MIVSVPILQMPLFRYVFSFVLCLLIVTSASTVTATGPTSPSEGDRLLQDRALQFMQQINTARRNPLAAAEQLGVDQDLVRAAFADSPWILDQGLPPLAWNPSLVLSSSAHGQDMFQRLYYSYVTPEGETVGQRIAAEGYQALSVGESMNALFFNNNYVPLDDAFPILVAAMLRDELRGETSVQRNLFSPDVTELGVAFFAESIKQSGALSYVYLLIVDLATPADSHRYAIITHDAVSRVVFHAFSEDYWSFPRLLRPGYTQVFFPEGGGDAVVIGDDGLADATAVYTLNDQGGTDHQNFNLLNLGDH